MHNPLQSLTRFDPYPLAARIRGWIELGGAALAAFTFLSTSASAISNVLPSEEWLLNWPRTQRAYRWLIKIVAGLALNFRRRLPSLDLPWFGFHQHHCPECQRLQDAAKLRDTNRTENPHA